MNKRFLYILITFFLVIIFYFKTEINNNVLSIFNQTKLITSDYISYIQTNIYKYFNQAKHIETLINENKKYEDYIAQINPILLNAKKLSYFKIIKNPKIVFTQTISYAKLPDITSIYIDYNKKISTPQGLIFNNQVAGIVVKTIKDFSLAYLNNNSKTSYTVFIGDNKIPGVLFGGDKIIIKYIPKYHIIKKGDLVITSGLDKIFYEGIKVGKIISIKQKELYQEAIIQPFYDTLHPTFFYIIKN